ncbi:contractile injection system protein, VgrG/Pvc8 family [Wukongibacter baidiensis]|uniref:contractile injection system protein, VgrG/Pvc8 family n=1 Tax=Wukongibacter baidiensis TaxID=1723361 RepID=UPI003D7F9ABF
MSQKDYLTIKDLDVTGDIKLEHIIDLTIEREIDNHSRLNLVGMVSEETKERLIEKIGYNSEIGINYEEKKVLFKGSISHVEAITIEGVNYITVEALSASWWLDQKRKKRSFDKEEATYKGVLQEIGKDYEGFGIIGDNKVDEKIRSYLVQYEETDFEFIKRMASRINLSVIVRDTANKPQIHIGLSQYSKEIDLTEAPYKSGVKVGSYAEANVPKPTIKYDNKLRIYTMEMAEVLAIGQTIHYKQTSYVITKMISCLDKGMLTNIYTMKPYKKIAPPTYHNEILKGTKLKGTVTQVKGRKVKVQLDIDEEGIENWYTYGTMGTSSMYCMPYTGDRIKVYFPSENEGKALAVESIYEGKGLDPNTKFWSNKEGKKIQFTPTSLEFEGKKDILNNEKQNIKMGKEEGVDVKSNMGIAIECNGLLSLKAKNIQIKALEGVHLGIRKDSRSGTASLLKKGLYLNPTDIQIAVKNKAILEGRTKQSFPFEEEPRPTLFQKPKPEKKKGGWGNFFKGLALAVVAVAAVAVAVAVCVVAAPLVGGLLAAGTASMALGVGIGVGLAVGTAVTTKGAIDVGLAGAEMMSGADYEDVAWRAERGFAFIGAGYGISMTALSYGMAAMPFAQYIDTYVNCRYFPGQGFVGAIFGRGTSPIPEVSNRVTLENSHLRVGYAKTTNNDRFFMFQWGGINPSKPMPLPAGNTNGLVPSYPVNLPVPNAVPIEGVGNMMLPPLLNGPSQLVPIGETGALMAPYISNPLLNAPNAIGELLPTLPLVDPALNKQQLIEAGNPNLYGRDSGVEVTGETCIEVNKAEQMVEEVYTGGRTQAELDDLARDPSHGFKIEEQGIKEREVGLALEERGDLGRIIRDTQIDKGAEFIDETTGIKWDVKSFESYPMGRNGKPITSPRKGAFTIQRGIKKIQKEFKSGNNVIIDTRKLVPEHIEQLKKAIDEAGIADRIIWYP